MSTKCGINSLFSPTTRCVVLEVSSKQFVCGVLEMADTTYRKLALAGSTLEEMNQAVVVILDTNTIQLEK